MDVTIIINLILGQKNKIQEFCADAKKLIQRLWNEEPDISHLEPVQWGIDNEENAITDFEAQLERRNCFTKVTKCGLFINRALPYFAVSPDGLFGDFLIEIKCPWVLREHGPDDVYLLKPTQRYSHFRKFCFPSGKFRLKRSHKYYAQCQLAMFVTGYRKLIFITQTPMVETVQDFFCEG